MSEEYVTKDLLASEVKRLEERTDNSIESVLIAIDGIKERLEDVKHFQVMSFARWGIATAVLICVVQIALNIWLR